MLLFAKSFIGTVLCIFMHIFGIVRPVGAISVTTREPVVAVSFLPIIFLALFVLFMKGKLDGPRLLLFIVLSACIVGTVAEPAIVKDKTNEDFDFVKYLNNLEGVEYLYASETVLSFNDPDDDFLRKFFYNKEFCLKTIAEFRAANPKLAYSQVVSNLGSKKQEIKNNNNIEHSNFEQSKVEISNDKNSIYNLVDEGEQLALDNCALSVSFEVDNCESKKDLELYRDVVEKCEIMNVKEAELSEMEMVIANIDSQSKNKKYQSTVNALFQYSQQLKTDDKVTICRIYQQIQMIKERYPSQFIYMKLVLQGKKQQVIQMFDNYENSKVTVQMKNWLQSDSLGRFSFRRIMCVCGAGILITILMPLLLSKQLMKHQVSIVLLVVMIGVAIVMF